MTEPGQPSSRTLKAAAELAHPQPETLRCPDNDEVVAFAAGRLTPTELSSLHQHVDGCETCQHLLAEEVHAQAIAPTQPSATSAPGAWNTTFRTGDLVARRYSIRAFIARGGMGEVYEAFDRELQERVALKTVNSTACDSPGAVRRLKAEVQLARRVGHPNVSRIYDFGSHNIESTGTQVHFLTMEFVEGETLGQRLRLCGALPLDEARDVARQLLLGLRAAHAAGILHRDFKSDNVMLRVGADGGTRAVILDFGLARALDQDSHYSTSVSTQSVVGTFGYMAPEQFEGKPLSVASDLYSFGVVLFEMLTGERPSATDSGRPSAGRNSQLPAPSSLSPSVSPGLDAVVMRCLRRSPAERFTSADEALAAVDAADIPRKSAGRAQLAWITCALGLGLVTTYTVFSLSRAAPRRQRSLEQPSTLMLAVSSARAAPSAEPDRATGQLGRLLSGVPALAASTGNAVQHRSPTPLPTTDTSRAARISAAPARTASAAPNAHQKASQSPPAATGSAPPPSTQTPPLRTPDASKPVWENPFGEASPTERKVARASPPA